MIYEGMCCSIDVFIEHYTNYIDNLNIFKHKTNNSYNNIKKFILVGISYISIDNIFKGIHYLKSKCVTSHPIFLKYYITFKYSIIFFY